MQGEHNIYQRVTSHVLIHNFNNNCCACNIMLHMDSNFTQGELQSALLVDTSIPTKTIGKTLPLERNEPPKMVLSKCAATTPLAQISLSSLVVASKLMEIGNHLEDFTMLEHVQKKLKQVLPIKSYGSLKLKPFKPCGRHLLCT